MKRHNLYTLYCLFFLHFTTNAQPKLVQAVEQIWLADSTKWRNAGRMTYAYEGDLLVKELEEYWFSSFSHWGNAEGAEYFYNDQGQKIKEILTDYNAGEDTYQNLYTNTFEYDDNGCLIAEGKEVVSIHGVYPQRYYSYWVDENCHVHQRSWITIEPNGDTTHRKNHFILDEVGKVRIDSQFAFFNDEWQLHYERFLDYDEAGRLTQRDEYLLFSSSNIGEYETWEYDEFGELIYRVKVRETTSNPYRIISKDSIILKYDDQDRVIERRTLAHNFGTAQPSKLESYKYYCQDILKQSKEERLPFIYRTTYEYDEGLDEACIENLSDQSILIYPNPAKDEITLVSDLLTGNQTQIYIYDALGRKFLEQDFFALHNTFSMSIADLNPGIYFVSIVNGNKIVTEKLSIH